jgi:uncharacterized protein YjiS (DUF1127 family)
VSHLTLPAARRAAFRPAAFLAGALARLMHEWTLRQALHAMGKLDDAALHDLGVDRGDLEAAVRHGRRALRH